MSRAVLHCGDVRSVLQSLPAESVQCCVTSPPYFNLRDYGMPGQIGLEGTVEEYVASMVDVFRGLRRVMRKDSTTWLNLSDSYASSGMQGPNTGLAALADRHAPRLNPRNPNRDDIGKVPRPVRQIPSGLKAKDLCGVPWRVAFALRADGWWLRSDIIWAKPNPMPESVTDRPTRSHEYLFLLTKSERYYWDAQAIAEESAISQDGRDKYTAPSSRKHASERNDRDGLTSIGYGDRNGTRNARSVWTIATQPYPEAHFATFPEELARRCILAGSSTRACEHCGAPWERVTESERLIVRPGQSSHRGAASSEYNRSAGGEMRSAGMTLRETVGWQPTCSCENTGSGSSTVLDPFAGSGTVAAVATGNGRNAIYIDLNPKYLELARQRIGPMLCDSPEAA